MRNITLTKQAFEDLRHRSTTEIKLLKKCFELIEAIARDPFHGIGKPEALKGSLQGFWSRRISDEHRVIYRATADAIIVVSLRSHYNI